LAAISVVVTAHSIGRDNVLTFEPRWWNPHELTKDRRFVRSNETGSYFDWKATLKEKEFIELHESFRADATGGIYNHPHWQARIQPLVQLIDLAIAGALGPLTRFDVQVFEWESGE
jgi:hypothetical protein